MNIVPPELKAARIRGRRLQLIRKAHFLRHPLCVHCMAKGIVRAATQLDHKVALVNGGEDVEENRQGLCDACHDLKTKVDMGYRQRAAIGLDGWPVEEGEGVKSSGLLQGNRPRPFILSQVANSPAREDKD